VPPPDLLGRFGELVRQAETAAGDLRSIDLPDALGSIERLKGLLWSRLNSTTLVTQTEAQLRAEVREVVRALRSEVRPNDSSKPAPRVGDVLLTVPQAAEALGIRPTTVRAWLSLRKLPVVRLGRAVRIKESDVRTMIDRGYLPARRPSP
jgi:excisionase family DNA binding protein